MNDSVRNTERQLLEAVVRDQMQKEKEQRRQYAQAMRNVSVSQLNEHYAGRNGLFPSIDKIDGKSKPPARISKNMSSLKRYQDGGAGKINRKFEKMRLGRSL